MRLMEIKAARTAAKSFLELTEALLKETADNDGFMPTGKTSGATRRASMDLTRALAEMRKPG